MTKPRLVQNDGKKYHRGKYDLKNPDKYIGNPAECLYRSSWELKLMIIFDHDPSIKKWGSETEAIPYQELDGSWHRYYVDFYVIKINNSNPGYEERLYIEIKPFKEKFPDFIRFDNNGKMYVHIIESKSPKAKENLEYQMRAYKKNLLKWQAAKKFCDKRGIQFVIITEKELKKKNIL